MASAVMDPACRAYLNKLNAEINDASQKEAQNYETITKLAKKILDLGGNVSTLEKPHITNPIDGPHAKLKYLQQNIQWQEKKIQQYCELVAKLNYNN